LGLGRLEVREVDALKIVVRNVVIEVEKIAHETGTARVTGRDCFSESCAGAKTPYWRIPARARRRSFSPRSKWAFPRIEHFLAEGAAHSSEAARISRIAT